MIIVYPAQDGMVEGGGRAIWTFRSSIAGLVPLAAQDLLEGGAHFLVAVGVDDGVHRRVEFGQQEEELLVRQDTAVRAKHIEQQQN